MSRLLKFLVPCSLAAYVKAAAMLRRFLDANAGVIKLRACVRLLLCSRPYHDEHHAGFQIVVQISHVLCWGANIGKKRQIAENRRAEILNKIA